MTGLALNAAPQVIVLPVSRGLMKNYNYLVVDPPSRQAVIVDPAWQMDIIEAAVTAAGATLRGVLVTHSHPDHIDLARTVAARYRCPIWMSREEAGLSGFSDGRLVELGPQSPSLPVGGLSIQAIMTPGHTPGCLCFKVGDNLFTGDVLFAEGCGMCPSVEAAHAMFGSLQLLKTTLPLHTRVFPGHSYGKPPGQLLSELLKDNIYLQFRDKDSFAAFRMRRGQSRAKMFAFT